jgi:Holliday junction resolvasome RuvABC ATP-dependent DNA helicase subunit
MGGIHMSEPIHVTITISGPGSHGGTTIARIIHSALEAFDLKVYRPEYLPKTAPSDEDILKSIEAIKERNVIFSIKRD